MALPCLNGKPFLNCSAFGQEKWHKSLHCFPEEEALRSEDCYINVQS
jgi:hypothetical protein